MATVEGFPAAAVTADLSASSVQLAVDATVHPLEAVYAAAYGFIDRCFVLLDRPDTSRYRVTLSTKKPGADDAALRQLAGEFANELLACSFRHQITQESRAVIEAVTMQAMAGAMGPPTLDDLAGADFADEPFDDPLGIAVSWEEKYGQKKQEQGAASGAAPAATGDAGAGGEKG